MNRLKYRKDSSTLSDSPLARPPVRLSVQQRHAQVAARPPLALHDVLELRGDEHEGRVVVGEGPDHAHTGLEPVLAGEARNT